MAGPTSFPRAAIFNGVDPFVRADDFATGDGTIDDTAALQAAINAAYGRLLFIPKGEYILSQNALTGYCLRIMDSVSILMEPGAVLKLATSVPNTVNAIQIGDGTTAVSGVSIEGGIIDGDAVANGGGYNVGKAAIYVSGPVQRIALRGVTLRNCLAAGIIVSGESSASRAKYITVEDCAITEVAEGVRFEKCDEFHMRGGSITKMMSQDGFEPHGANIGWSLRDCYIAEPHPTNSAIEVFPQWGHIESGLIENCTIIDDELRVSIQSGVAGSEVRDLVVRNCYFKNANIYAGVGGEFRNLIVEGCRIEGPCNVPRNTSKPFCGILSQGSSNTITVRSNRISHFQSRGIHVTGHDCVISENEVFNNGQDTLLSGNQRYGIFIVGNRARVHGNLVYDNQAVPTQTAGLAYGGNDGSYIGNKLWGNVVQVNNSGLTPLRTKLAGNLGIAEIVKTVVTVAAGVTVKDIDSDAIGISSQDFTSAVVQPRSSMAPATHAWTTRSGGVMKLNLNAAPANSVNFLIVFHLSPEFTTHP